MRCATRSCPPLRFWLLTSVSDRSVVVIEEVFAYPAPRLIVYAVTSRHVPLLQATVLTVASVYCLVNFLADLAYGWVNPRIRYQ